MTLQMSGENLNRMIKQSGLKKIQVAHAKGITPQSLSRQISGLYKINLKDAEDYAKILQCSVKDILIDKDPIEMFGILDDSYLTPGDQGTIKVHDASQAKVYIYNAFDLPPDITYIRRDLTALNRHLNGSLMLFSNKAVQSSTVCPKIHGKKAIVKLATGQIWICIPWENRDGTYRVQSIFSNNMLEDTSFVWGTTLLMEVMRPEDCGLVPL